MPTSRTTRFATRLTAAAVGVGLLGATAAYAVGGFDDVPDDHPHAAGVEYVAGTGVTVGCDADSFCPQDGLTRGQMATFLHRASGNDPATPPSVNAATLGGRTAGDLLAAAVHVTRDGADQPVVSSFTNNVNGAAPVVTLAGGGYEIDFGFDVSGRFPQCSVDTNFVDTRDALCTLSVPSPDLVRVRIHDASVGGSAPAEFWLTLNG
ncbi:hypothetical protein BH20ACT2_BH20ACT2_03380 [soil metagenome]